MIDITFRIEPSEDDGPELICPYFRCATCGEPIFDAATGIVVAEWERVDGTITGNLVDPVIVHKGACDGFRGRPWRPLKDLIQQLAFNSRMPATAR